MKKLAIIIYCLCSSVMLHGQVSEVVINDSIDQYNGTSYEVVENFKLVNGFRARAGVEGMFFSKMKNLFFTPLANTTNPANTDIMIVFNDIIDTTAINSKIIISGSQSGVVPGQWTQDGRQLVFDSDNDFQEGEIITVDISDLLVGQLGRWLAGQYTWQFDIELPMTYVPDDAFELALIGIGVDNILDDSVATSGIVGLTSLDLSNLGISNLIGIEDFVGLTVLECDNNSLTSLDISSNTNLIELYCHANQLTGLNVTNNGALNRLTCGGNPLMQLDVSNNHALTRLECFSSQLSALDVSSNVALTTLDCRSNQLLNLDLSNNPALTSLSASSNLLVDLDLTANPALTVLTIPFNQLTSLDIFNNTLLTNLDCKYNQFASLDLSNNVNLTNLSCQNNHLTDLDVSANGALTVMQCANNLNLKCIQVSSTQLSAISPFWHKDLFASYSENCDLLSMTYIPDDGFEQALITLGYDNIMDDSVNTAVVQEITNLTVNNSNISDMTGLEDFTSLVTLSCRSNQLTSLDVSANTLLETLNCSSNMLASLNLSGNSVLKTLYAFNNQLATLDLANNTLLSTIDCANNQLDMLDVSMHPDLRLLDCSSNQLTGLSVADNSNLLDLLASSNPLLTCIEVSAGQLAAIPTGWSKDATATYTTDCSTLTYVPDDNFELALISQGYDNILDDYVITSIIADISTLSISGLGITDLTGISDFTSLTSLDCSNNALTNLDLSANSLLTTLDCSTNQLTTLTFINNPALTTLDCSSNQMTSLNVFANPALTTLDCSSNLFSVLSFSNNLNLTTLNVSDNRLHTLFLIQNIGLTTMDCTLNAPLFCVRVNSSHLASIPAQWNKDALTSYSTDCSVTYVPDNNFEQELISQGLDTGLDGKVLTSIVESVTVLDISNKGISDLTGLEDFTALEELDCSSNQLVSMNLSQNLALRHLNCSFNQLYQVYFNANTQLTTLNCSYNTLDFLDLRNMPMLTSVLGNNNQLRYLFIGESLGLITLDCSSNPLLTALDVTNNVDLETLDCASAALSSLNVSNSPGLTTLDTRSNLPLFCVQISADQLSYPATSTWNKSVWTNFSLFCSSSSRTLESNESTSLEQVSVETSPSISLYPNPVNYEFTLELEDFEGAHIEIHDLIGNLLYRGAPLIGLKTNVSVKDLSPGLVVVTVIRKKVVKSFKLLIER